MFETGTDPYPLFLVTQGVEFYDIKAKGKITSIEEKVCEEKMADDYGKVEEFTEDEADEIVGVPATQNFDKLTYSASPTCCLAFF